MITNMIKTRLISTYSSCEEISIAEPMIGDSFKSHGILQMPLFAFFVEKLVEIFVTNKTFVLYGRSTHWHRSVFFPAICKTKFFKIQN